MTELNEIQKLVFSFLKNTNMNSNPDEWEKGYKEFKKQNKGVKMTYKEFDDIVTSFMHYYFIISFDYDFDKKTFGQFIIKETQD